MIRRLFLLTLLLLAPAPAAAQEVFGAILVHDVDTPLTRSGQENGADVQFGWRGPRIGGLDFLGGPSPHVFASVNTAGDTNYLGAGISWRIGDPVYVRPGIGIAVHDGRDRDSVTPDRIDFGSRLIFVPEIALGYRIDEAWSVEASWVHFSHGQLLSRHNPGSDNFGVRINYRYR